jgi:hypothetical protein
MELALLRTVGFMNDSVNEVLVCGSFILKICHAFIKGGKKKAIPLHAWTGP